MSPRTMKFKQWKCWVELGRYHDGSPAISLYDEATGEPVARCTCCLHERPDPGYVFVKDWSENEGMLAAMIEAGLVEDTGNRVPTGFVEVAVCRLRIPMGEFPEWRDDS